MTICVPDPFAYGLLVAAVLRGVAKNGGLRSIAFGSDGSQSGSSKNQG